MVGVYCISHAPGLLLLSIPGYEGREHLLIVFLVTVVQASDVLQYLWGKALGRTPLLPALSPSKTVEGLVGGVLSAAALGGLLSWLTPFPVPEAIGLALVCALAGACGGAVMSAIKRDAGVKDYGSLIIGHGGLLDRVDSVAFAAPLFFHLVRWLHSTS
jgi:phosphatidate cytidylyltransferase